MSEVFYPDLSTPSIRSLELVVTDGETFTDRTSRDTTTTVERPDPRSLRFTQVNTDRDGRYEITEKYVTSPDHDSVTVRVRLVSLDGGDYRLYALHDPALTNDGMDDRARTRGDGLLASDGDGRLPPARPAGLRSPDQRPRRHRQRPVARPAPGPRPRPARAVSAGPGNVVQLGRVTGVTGRAGAQRATLTLGLGPRRGLGRAAAPAPPGPRAGRDPAGVRRRLGRATSTGSSRCRPAPPPSRTSTSPRPWCWPRPRTSSTGARSSPRRRRRGSGATRSRTCPRRPAPTTWSGRATPTSSGPRCGPWATAPPPAASSTGCSACSRSRTARSRRTPTSQGTPVWGELQLDEVALPIVLAGLVGKDDDRHLARASAGRPSSWSAFRDEETGRRAPYSPQERWENQSGYSPNSIAAQISGLVVAADMARDRGRHGAGARSGSTRPTAGSARSRTGRSRPTGRCRRTPTSCG